MKKKFADRDGWDLYPFRVDVSFGGLIMQAYLDNSATTRCLERVTDKRVEVMRTDFGNPSSLHTKGVEAEK